VPWYARATAFLDADHALSPVDLIPDFIPILGYLDDIVIVPLGILLAVKLIPPDILVENAQRPRARKDRRAASRWSPSSRSGLASD
jgi:uncharacterized membrane protein YkvA (DUF1232 family)